MKVIEVGTGTGRAVRGYGPVALSQRVGWEALPWGDHSSDRADFVCDCALEKSPAAAVPAAQSDAPTEEAAPGAAPKSGK